MTVLTTCPRCGRPAQRETAPHGESYITCGHCGQITFDQTGEEDGPIDIPSVLEVDEPDSEFYAPDQDTLREWAREDEGPDANTCHNCAGAHPTWRCPGPQNDVCWSCGDQLAAPTYGPALCGTCQEAGERWPEIKPALTQYLSA